MDIVSPQKRSEMMSGIRGKNTKPERLVRSLLFKAGYRFRLHRKDLPGTPDIVMPGRRVAIFVHGCFWHQHHNCSLTRLPKSNAEFWKTKLSGNERRDLVKYGELASLGWRVLVIWECAIRRRQNVDWLIESIIRWIDSGSPFAELPSTGGSSGR
jgi:DNA mismatch endonuclease (patch repair protein)